MPHYAVAWTCSRSLVSHNGIGVRIWSTNPLETLTSEIKRRTDVVGVPPQPGCPAPGFAGANLVEQHDKWEASTGAYFYESSMLELKTMNTLDRTGRGGEHPA
jgi:transposase-like protein